MTRRWWRAASALVALALVASGCSEDGDDDAGATTTASSTEARPEEDLTRVEVLGGPDWLAADDEWVYLRRDDGGVDRVDAATGAVEASAEIPEGDRCQGIGAGDGTIWTCRGTDVVQVDLETGELVTEVAVGKTATQGHLAVVAGRVWVLTGDGSVLVGVEVTTGEVGPELELGARGSDLVASDDAVYVASATDDTVLRVDPEPLAVAWTAPDVAAVSLAVGEGVVHAGGRQLTRLDAATGEVLGVADVGPGPDGGVAADGDDVWVRSAERGLVRVGPDGAVVAEHALDVESGGDVLVAHGAVWATAYDDAALFRLPNP